MPRVSRRRTIAAPRAEVWALVSDPYNLPRWWPRTGRVESVEGEAGAEGTQWTKVLETPEGRGVRADFRCSDALEGKRYAWEQRLADTPFERHLRRYAVEIGLDDADAETAVTVIASQTLRGLSRLGSPMMRGAQAKVLDGALDGLERALT
ncbi:MAG: SRPBCC family protein [Solirubrobacterales bacterium]